MMLMLMVMIAKIMMVVFKDEDEYFGTDAYNNISELVLKKKLR